MRFLVAAKPGEEGCLAVKMEGGPALAGLATYLGLRTLDKGIEIMTISTPDAYGEYEPYQIVDSEKEFIWRVLDM